MFLLWDYGGACLRAEFKDCRIVFRLNEVLAFSFVYCINNWTVSGNWCNIQPLYYTLVSSSCHQKLLYDLILSSRSFWSGLFHLWIWSEPFNHTVSHSQKDKECRSRWDGSLWSISSESTLFAKYFVWSAGLKGLISQFYNIYFQFRFIFNLLFYNNIRSKCSDIIKKELYCNHLIS